MRNGGMRRGRAVPCSGLTLLRVVKESVVQHQVRLRELRLVQQSQEIRARQVLLLTGTERRGVRKNGYCLTQV